MLCKMVTVTRKKRNGSFPVYLNVYDLTPINGYAYWVGLGVYHSGVQGKRFELCWDSVLVSMLGVWSFGASTGKMRLEGEIGFL